MNVLHVPEVLMNRLGWLLVRIAGSEPGRCRGGAAGFVIVRTLLVGVAAVGLCGAASAADEAAQSKGQLQKESASANSEARGNSRPAEEGDASLDVVIAS